METHNIVTRHPSKRYGVAIPRYHYNVFKEYILTELGVRKEVALDELLADAVRLFSPRFAAEVPWYFLTVKLDLEARGMIQVRIQTKGERRQIIKAKRHRLYQ
jgi:hypothetical protein